VFTNVVVLIRLGTAKVVVFDPLRCRALCIMHVSMAEAVSPGYGAAILATELMSKNTFALLHLDRAVPLHTPYRLLVSLLVSRRPPWVPLQVRSLIQSSDPDPSMYGALPPGAWWEVANGAALNVQPYADKAGDAAVAAARQGDLELRTVHFAYPMRRELPGRWWALRSAHCTPLVPGQGPTSIEVS